jgi:copper chaperone CopZ
MTQQLTASLPLIQPATSGCGCCTPRATDAPLPAPVKEKNMSTAPATHSYAVTGMTCGHCVAAVSEELSALPGVTGVNVDLVAGGVSTVTVSGNTTLTPEQVAAALDEAGDYHLAAD